MRNKTNIDADGVILMEAVKPFVRTKYNYVMDEVSRETGLETPEETKAQQQFKDEVDINTIIKNFGVTGMLPINERPVLNEEFVEATDYQQALNKIIEADAVFMTLPADVRKEFQNDAGKFVEFASDEKNIDKMREWGMAKPKAVDEPPRVIDVRVVPEKPAGGA